ncbi:FACT complex subunit SSRP1-like [Rhincodon typus]|uniref:FACT complex subunit SSRP1-like n=1 Tax=Rhincodon typus TaxID=259920 RepID=UPI0009A3B957|nr:FACT complex subunit SSRP1-like [Rhincodon typus]XP_048449537.1 FACT complex subunit SSRP1-like [Rhincodon typus]
MASSDILEYNDIYQELKGTMIDGRLRLSRQTIVFKNSKTGKVDSVQASDVSDGVWRRVARGYGIRLQLKNGNLCKFDGFREGVSVERQTKPEAIGKENLPPGPSFSTPHPATSGQESTRILS